LLHDQPHHITCCVQHVVAACDQWHSCNRPHWQLQEGCSQGPQVQQPLVLLLLLLQGQLLLRG
jgi:hypothetical protein